MPPLAVASVALFLALGQVDRLMRQLQAENASSAGLQSLVWGWPDAQLFSRARDVVHIWNTSENAAFAERCIWAYTGLDVAFVVVYSWLLLVLLHRLRGTPEPPADAGWLSRQARRPLPWVAALALVDLIEDGLLAVVATERRPATDPWLLACLLATALKWLLLVVVLGQVGALLRERRAWLRRLLTDTRDAIWQLRAPALMSGVFGLLLIADPTGQTPDLLRRWMDSSWMWAWSTVATIAFGVGLWAAARRILLGHYRGPAAARSTPGAANGGSLRKPPSARSLRHLVQKIPEPGLIGGGVALLSLGLLLDLRRLEGVAGVVLAIYVIGRLRFLLVRNDLHTARLSSARAERAASAEFPGEVPSSGERLPERERRLGAIQRVARAIAVWPVVALGLALASAFTAPPLVLASSHVGGENAVRDSMRIALGGAIGAVAAAGIGTILLRFIDRRTGTAGGLPVLGAVAVPSAVALGLAIWKPLDVAPDLGVVTVLAAAFTVMVAVVAELERLAEVHLPPDGLIALNFRRTPVLLLLLVALIVASLVSPNDDHHDVVHLKGAPPPAADVSHAWREWVRQSCARRHGEPIPLVIVGAHGGGVRAAYWTAATMTALIPDPNAAVNKRCGTVLHQVFALSGISGGSLGLTSYASWAEHPSATDWYEPALGEPDSLAPVIAWLAVDGTRAFVGFRSEDRARVIERAWEKHDSRLSADFFSRPEPPYLLLGGATVESGCRINVSTLRLSPPPSRYIQTRRPTAAQCAALRGRSGTLTPTLAPAAPQTEEVLDYLCGPEPRLRRSTASLLSARFPYVSPSGRLPSCRDDVAPTAIVDGGYVEGTGARSALDLWRQLEPLVARHNRAAWRRDQRRGRLVVPVYVQLDNHYTAVAAPAPQGRTQELLAPAAAKLRANANDDRAIEQEIRATFLASVPGVPGLACNLASVPRRSVRRYVRIAPVISPGLPAPLAWTLSKMSRDDLIQQRNEAMRNDDAAALRSVLTGQRGLTCNPPPARSQAQPFTGRPTLPSSP